MKRFRGAAIVALMCTMAGCGDGSPTQPDTRTPLPVIINSNVNLQLTDTPIGEQPRYTVTSFVTATQAGNPVSAGMDSIVLSYRLNNGPFVVGAALRVPVFSGLLPFTVQRGDQYHMFARLYAHGTGTGRTATAIADFDASGMAVDSAQ